MPLASSRHRLAVLGRPDVPALWLAGVGAGVVRWLGILAVSLHVLAETGSAPWVALAGFARFLPLLLLGAPLAVLAGRVDRRRLLLAAYAIMAAAEGLGAAAAFAGQAALWWVLPLAFAAGVFWCVEIPVRRALLAEAGGADRVAVAMGLEMVTTHLTRTLGPALGGALFAGAGLAGVLALGAALYLAGAALVAGTTARPPAPSMAAAGRPRFRADLAEGVALIRADPRLLAIVALTFAFNLWGLPYLALVPVLAEGRLGLGPVGTGLLASAEGAGAVVGSALVLAFARPAWFGPVFGLGCALFFLAEIAFALAPGPLAAFAALFVAGLGMAGFSSMQTTLPVAVVPAALRVRVMGAILASIGSAPLGFALAGALGDRLGAGPAVALMGTLGLGATLLGLRRWPVIARPARPGAAGPP